MEPSWIEGAWSLVTASPQAVSALALAASLAACALAHTIAKSGQRGRARSRRRDDEAQYRQLLKALPYRAKAVLNASEAKLYRSAAALASENGWIALAQVRIADFVELAEGHDPGGSDLDKRAWREISQKHVDILLVDKGSRMPVAAVECDGPMHISDANTKRNDAFKDALFARIGLPIARLPSDSKLADPAFVARKLTLAGLDVPRGRNVQEPSSGRYGPG